MTTYTFIDDRIFGGYPAKNTIDAPYIYTVFDRIFGDFPAKNTVHTPHIHGCMWFWPPLHMPSQNRA